MKKEFVSPEDIKPYEHHVEHFIEKLKERYNIEITRTEYDELCSNFSYDGFLFKLNVNLTLCYINIKGVKVLCIKRNTLRGRKGYNRKEACIVTCLYDEQYRWPIPEKIRYKISKLDFWKRYNTYIDIIEELSSKFTEEKRKEYFVDKPFGDYPIFLYKIGYDMNRGLFGIHKLVDYITNEYENN